MTIAKVKAAVVAGVLSVMTAGMGVVGYEALADGPTQEKSKPAKAVVKTEGEWGEIPAADFPKFFRLFHPNPGTQTWQSIPWITGHGCIAEARKRAAKEGKPILMFTTAGHPLGIG